MKATIDAGGLGEALAALDRLAGDLPGKALADAINHTGYQARKALHTEMASVFDRPTPWTLKSVQLLEAKPQKLQASLWINDYPVTKDLAPDKWLKAQVFGGPRSSKGLDVLLRAKGILPAGMFAFPAIGARLDRYGNLSPGHIAQIKSGLKIADRAGYTGNASTSARSMAKQHAKAFFVVRRAGRPIGIGERRDWGPGSRDKWVMVLAFGRQPKYVPRLDFHRIANEVSQRELATNIDAAIIKALDGTLGAGYRRRR